MFYLYNEQFKNFIYQRRFLFFQIGVFLILSAPNIAAFFLLISLFSTHFDKNINSKKNNWMQPFLISGILAILSAINSSFRGFNIEGWDKSLSWWGLGNWIPFFYFAWRSQIFLETFEMRRNVGNMFLAGTVPFIFSSFGQLWFQWHGPFIFLNGLIIWFQRSIDFDLGQGVTAMFNNQNYAACWLIIIWPFCINKFLSQRGFSVKKFIYLIYSILIIFCVYLTQSRGGLLGSITSTLFITNKYMVGLLLLIIFAYLFATLSIIPQYIQNIFRKLISENILQAFEFSQNINILNDPRIFIYLNTIPIIMERPILGWGASTFPILFNTRYTEFTRDPTHPHNLILEMANSYGLIFSILITGTILLILINSFKLIFLKRSTIYKNKNSEEKKFDRAWWSSFFALFVSQMYDVQYFDFRISISFWILLTGLTCIIK